MYVHISVLSTYRDLDRQCSSILFVLLIYEYKHK
jgi:hypothetical protein